MAEFNGDQDGGDFDLGVDWIGQEMTAAPGTGGNAGSYLGNADQFNDRRLVADSNGSAVMVGVAAGASDTFPFSTPDNEATIRAGFEHPLTFFMAPDVWYMNGDFDVGDFWENGVDWSTQRITALESAGAAGNYIDRASVLVGKTFRAANGVEMLVTSEDAASNANFTTTANEADFRAAFEFPNMWREIRANGNTLPDCRFQALRDQGFTGQTNDMLLQWLQFNGATSGCLPDAWYEMLISQGIPPTHRNDMWRELLVRIGFNGQINDSETAFWCAGGVIPPIPPFDALYDEGEALTDNGDFLTETGEGPMAEYKDVYPFRANQTDHGLLQPADGDVQLLGFNELLPVGTYKIHLGFTTDWTGLNDQVQWHVNGPVGIASPNFLKESKDAAEVLPQDYDVPDPYTHTGGQLLVSLFAEALDANVVITDVSISAQRVSDPA